jgi:asparagine synthase (glutamine-hydrolysing)
MHGIDYLKRVRDYYTINLNGFLGDAIIGGSYINSYNNSIIRKVDNRGRRFIAKGTYLGSVFYEYNRKPFFDNKFIDYVFSIPLSFKYNSYIYNKFLLYSFPEYFKDIPWQNTGYPISMHPQKVALLRVGKKLKNNLFRVIKSSKSDKYAKSFIDYNLWLKSKPTATFFQNILLNKQAIYSDYFSREQVASELEAHLNGRADYSDNLCRYLTFELWLQQCFNKQYRRLE